MALTGLYVAIANSDFDDVNRVVEKWKDLDPLILGKWKLITDRVPDDEAVRALKRASTYLFTTLYYDEKGELIMDGPLLQYTLGSSILDYIFSWAHLLPSKVDRGAQAGR
ncbi:MAG: hypothetical protein ACTSXC_06870 [Candidatus Freyarchaeota archaeon]